jgi:hypothetical protein
MPNNSLQIGAAATFDFMGPQRQTVARTCFLGQTRHTIPNAMEPTVTLIVFLSALMHASWNAVVKGAKNGLVTQGAVVLGGAVYAIPLLFLPIRRSMDLLGLKRDHSLRMFCDTGDRL